MMNLLKRPDDVTDSVKAFHRILLREDDHIRDVVVGSYVLDVFLVSFHIEPDSGFVEPHQGWRIRLNNGMGNSLIAKALDLERLQGLRVRFHLLGFMRFSCPEKEGLVTDFRHVLNIDGSLFIDPDVVQLVGNGGETFVVIWIIGGSEPDEVLLVLVLFDRPTAGMPVHLPDRCGRGDPRHDPIREMGAKVLGHMDTL